MDLPAKRRVQGCPPGAAAGTAPPRACSGRRGASALRVHSPSGLGHSKRGSTVEWSPAEPCREGLGIAVGVETAEFSTSHYSLESYTCWNTAGP